MGQARLERRFFLPISTCCTTSAADLRSVLCTECVLSEPALLFAAQRLATRRLLQWQAVTNEKPSKFASGIHRTCSGKRPSGRVQPQASDGVLGAALDQGGLSLEDLKSLLETSNLIRSGLLQLLVGRGCLVALIVELLKLLFHGCQLALRGLQVALRLCGGLVQVLKLLRLEFHSLLLLSCQDLVLLRLLLVLGDRTLLLAGDLGEPLLEVAQAYLQEADDPRRRAIG